MISTIEFFVPGVAKTAGSKKAFPIWRGKGSERKFVRSVIVDDAGQAGKDWRASVQFEGVRRFKEVMGPVAAPLQGPLAVEFVFTVTRPKGHTGKKGLHSWAPPFPTTKPDVLKLARSVEDALTGIIWKDDAQIVAEVLRKRYGDHPGCLINVMEVAL